MPPSGFSSNAVSGATTLLETNFNDLLAETRSGKHKSFEDGIRYEIALIDKASADLPDGIVKGVLALTKGGYVELLRDLPSHPSPEAAIAAKAREAARVFKQLHIDDAGNLVERKVA